MTADVTCTRCGADDLGCTACGAQGTLVAQPDTAQPTEGGALTEGDLASLRGLGQGQVPAVVERIKADAYAAGLVRGVFDPDALPGARDEGWRDGRDHERRNVLAELAGEQPMAADLRGALAARRQRPEGVTLMTEPHDGHAANETCPGCPHPGPEGVTVTEWQMLRPDGRVYMNYRGGRWSTLRSMTRSRDFIGGTIEMRQRTSFPDVVTEWAEVSGDTEAGNGSSCCPGAGTMAHVRGCRNHPEAGGPR